MERSRYKHSKSTVKKLYPNLEITETNLELLAEKFSDLLREKCPGFFEMLPDVKKGVDYQDTYTMLSLAVVFSEPDNLFKSHEFVPVYHESLNNRLEKIEIKKVEEPGYLIPLGRAIQMLAAELPMQKKTKETDEKFEVRKIEHAKTLLTALIFNYLEKLHGQELRAIRESSRYLQ